MLTRPAALVVAILVAASGRKIPLDDWAERKLDQRIDALQSRVLELEGQRSRASKTSEEVERIEQRILSVESALQSNGLAEQSYLAAGGRKLPERVSDLEGGSRDLRREVDELTLQLEFLKRRLRE